MASREPQRPEIDANRRREPLKHLNLSGQLALMGETRRFRQFFRKLLGKKERANGLNRIQRVRITSRWITGATRKDSLRRAYCVVACGGGGSYPDMTRAQRGLGGSAHSALV
jgi:hypothetical protein